jgi:N-acyl amino acid synthase of PEP-CTERM/exosortase system
LSNFVACYRQHFEVVRASTPSLLDEVYRLRYQVYCVERRFESTADQVDGREVDIDDPRSVHVLLIHRRTGAIAGTVRAILPLGSNPGVLLPIQRITRNQPSWPLHYLPPNQTAEISRFAVSKEFRQRCIEQYTAPAHRIGNGMGGADERRLLRYITFGLIQGALEICQEYDIRYVCAVMERALIRLLARLGLSFEFAGELVYHHGLRQPCFARIDQLLERSRAAGTLLWRYANDAAQPDLCDRHQPTWSQACA